jgi:hypothetical protein
MPTARSSPGVSRPEAITLLPPLITRGAGSASVPDRQSAISLTACATRPCSRTPIATAARYPGTDSRSPSRTASAVPRVIAVKDHSSTGITLTSR